MSPRHPDPDEREERMRKGREASGRTDTPNILKAPQPGRLRSLEYGLAILGCFAGEWHTLGIAEIADLLGVSRSTVHRYALTLVVMGWMEQDDRRKYRLASRAGDVGRSILSLIAARAGSWPVLQELRAQTGHTASFGVLDRAQATYLQRAYSHGQGQHQADGDLGPGLHLPLHCTALGKAMLASQSAQRQRELIVEMTLTREGPNTITTKHELLRELARCKVAGIAIRDEEHTAGVRSIAVAVNRRSRAETFAVEVTVPSAHHTVAELIRDIGPALCAAGQGISTHLRGGA
jgi:DNA-binding IclR family transcriptional regulator